jgi:hypothetical protein
LPAESALLVALTLRLELIPFVQGDGCGGSLIADDIVLTAAHCAGVLTEKSTVGPNHNTARLVAPSASPCSLSPILTNPTLKHMTLCCSSRWSVSNPNLKPHPLNRTQQPCPQRRSDCDRFWCQKTEDGSDPVEASERRRDFLQHL